MRRAMSVSYTHLDVYKRQGKGEPVMSEKKNPCEGCSQENCDSCSQKSFLAPPNPGSHIKKVIAVVSGKGGVGKSLTTCSLAVTCLLYTSSSPMILFTGSGRIIEILFIIILSEDVYKRQLRQQILSIWQILWRPPHGLNSFPA